MVYLQALQEQLADAIEERSRLDGRIEQLEDAIAALRRLEGEEDDAPPRRESPRFRGEPDDEPPLRGSVSDGLPRRGWVSDAPPRPVEPRADIRALLDRHREDISEQIGSLESSLPFVGLKYYRDQLLPQVVGEIRQGELRSLMDLMVDSGVVDVYQVENPNNPDFPTAAIRLPFVETPDEPDEPDDRDEFDDLDGADDPYDRHDFDDPEDPDEADDPDEPEEAEEFDGEPR